ncbi:unnamed protein product [Polarella glacialis]|uniref:Uncharacterized protein n=2 Tax=Polarella glacialis TaxID=89957 RepID=A0A813HFJ9_POLGL|nr:unnamed protein product [Polarella glacialis]CAE8637116.1 unnamed protein product [Polarella glacialis]
MLVRLMWTGRTGSKMSQPCPYIYEEQPGLVPYQGENVHCTGNSADCAAAKGMPLQPAGATFAFTQSLQSSYRASVGGSCDLHPAQLNYPGASQSLVATTKAMGVMGSYASLWACNTVIDPVNQACKLIANPELRGSLSAADFWTLFNYPQDPLQLRELQIKIAETAAKATAASENATVAVIAAIAQLPPSSWMATYFNTFMDLSDGDYEKAMASRHFAVPSFTEDLLASACKAELAFFLIDASPLLGGGKTPEDAIGRAGPCYPHYKTPEDVRWMNAKKGKCDHFVFLETCDLENDLYTVWTWGSKRYLTKQGLLGRPVTATGDPNPAGPWNTGLLCFATLGSLSSVP